MLSETGLTVTEGHAAGTSYTVRLATEPTGEVTVTVSVGRGLAGTDLTLDKTSLTFTVDNWDTAHDRDGDTAGVTIEPTALSVVAGRSNEYTVKLATEPTGEAL